MAMQFWEAKRRHRFRTFVYIVVFLALACAVSWIAQVVLLFFAQEGYSAYIPHFGFLMVGFICLVSLIYYMCYASFGGSMVAESMGGIKLELETVTSSKERELYHIVQEMAIASRLPMPSVYLIQANEINAFAAGLKPEKSVIAVTTGALTALNRDELQGVVAHEFGHIATGDMRIGMRLAALLMGFFIIFYLGLRLLEGSMLFGRRNDNGKGSSAVLIALILLGAGVIMWFAGSILRACVSREREYMADASAVEFTRNPDGIASALKKIEIINEQVKDMPKSGLGYSHLYLDNRSFMSRLFATHPPIKKRIAAIEDQKIKDQRK